MSRRSVTLVLVLAAAAALAGAYLLPPRIGHPVTPFMESAADDAAGRAVARLPGNTDRPAVVVFVLPGCPCSESFAPYVGQLHRAYGDRVNVIDVVAGDERAAEEWKQSHRLPYLVAADAAGHTAREFGAERSAYTAVVVRGKIVRLWPGYSAGMLRELGGLLADVTGTSEQVLDVTEAPARLTSGCLLDR